MTDPKLREVAVIASGWAASENDTLRGCGRALLEVVGVEEPDHMPAGWNRPAFVAMGDLIAAVEDMLDAIKANDSAGGFLEYEWADRAGYFEVRCRYRIGNAEGGQGGVRVVHESRHGPSA